MTDPCFGPAGRPPGSQGDPLAGVGAVLLVEFINADQFPGQIAQDYPFLQGWCRWRGVAVRWLRFGIAASNFFVHRTDAVTLSAPELARLQAVAGELRPDLAVLTHELRAEQAAAWRAGQPGLRLVRFDRLLDAELARNTADSFIFHQLMEQPDFAPDYRWEAGNAAAARRDRDNVYLLLRRLCGYRRPVETNPLYADVPLGPEVRTRGCAFCGVTAARDREALGAATPAAWVTKQLEAVRQSFGPDRAPNAVLLDNLEGAAVLRTVLADLDRLGLAAAKVLFGLRLDRLLGLRDVLERELPELQRRGRAIHLYVLGLETFSDDELLRLNKGFTATQALAALRLLRELEGRYPETFHYSGYMPIAMILFTPWTTPEGLDRDLGLVQHLGLEAAVGNLFVARLRLHPNLALTALARRDGLLVEAAEDEGLLLNRRKLFPQELPWRFADPRLEPVNGFAVRLEGGADFAGDPLHERVQALKARHPGGWDRPRLVALLRCLGQAARTASAPLRPDELLRRAERLWVGQQTAARLALPRARLRIGDTSLAVRDYLWRILPVLGEDRPVLSLERLPPAALTAPLAAALAAQGVHAAWGAAARGAADGGATLYLSRDPAALDRARALAGVLAGAPDPAAAAAARREAGRLHGAPECCARAWSESPWAHGDLVRWALLAQRLEAPGPADPEANPLLVPDLAFVPCAPGCPQATARYRAWLGRLAPLATEPARERRAFLFRLAGPDDLASFGPRRDGEWLHFDPALVRGDGALARDLARGDRLRVTPAQLQLWDGERAVAVWTATVGLWDPAPTAAVAAAGAAWRELALAAQFAADPAAQQARERAREAFRHALADPATSAGS